jgi:hypothetical protein
MCRYFGDLKVLFCTLLYEGYLTKNVTNDSVLYGICYSNCSVRLALKQLDYNCCNAVTDSKTNAVTNRFGVSATTLCCPVPFLLKWDAINWFSGTKSWGKHEKLPQNILLVIRTQNLSYSSETLTINTINKLEVNVWVLKCEKDGRV